MIAQFYAIHTATLSNKLCPPHLSSSGLNHSSESVR